jgi:carboxymethylenebutenolidase
VLVPDLFWRLEPRIDLGYGDDDRKRGFALMQTFDQGIGAGDIKSAAAWLRRQLGSEPIALVGFCLGGRMAVLVGADNPDVSAVVALYGVRLDQCADEIRAINVPFQFHVGERDAHVPAEHVTAVREAIAGKPGANVFVYPGAQHGFYNRQRQDVFAPEAAALARARTLALLEGLA